MDIDIEMLRNAPEKQVKIAQDMMVHDVKPMEQIEFLLIGTQTPKPVECVWLDPSFGMFCVKGHEEKGFMRINQLPEGTIILNQRVVKKEARAQ